jgi:hypothetical protein
MSLFECGLNDVLKALLDNDTRGISNQERLRLISSSRCSSVSLFDMALLNSDLDNWAT